MTGWLRNAVPDFLRAAIHRSPIARLVWISGLVVAVVITASMGAHLVLEGAWSRLPAWIAGVTLVPARALTLGVCSGTSKPFEMRYVAWWCVGALRHVHGLDFTGMKPATAEASPYLLATALLLALCYPGRRRQIAHTL